MTTGHTHTAPSLRNRLITTLALVVFVVVCVLVFPGHPQRVQGYDRFFFYYVQSARVIPEGSVPFSIGDVLYVLGGIWLLVTIAKWIYYIIKFRERKKQLAASVVRSINTVLIVYLIFFMGWGANYYKRPLGVYWQLYKGAQHHRDTAALIAFDRFLIDKMNTYAPGYHSASLKQVSDKASDYYRTLTDCHDTRGLGIKGSLFGNIMERFDIEGYYNPFTGEGQVNDRLPAYMLPFTVCHEMAHQAGIAAEEDANLMAYSVGTTAADSSFRYSCYFNIWLYAHNRLYFRDSALANRLEANLNQLSKAHEDTLEQINKRYHGDITKYSGEVYDSYLRMQDQHDGLRSYGNVTTSAWLLEQQRAGKTASRIVIP